uniref:Arf-GAP domain-containing protein n=1 Tax=Ditylenchus dipsaci TaxID=166011 RepID=A0A915EPM0_9BILA
MSVNSSSAAQRKKLEEKNARAVRELMNIPANKFCFECGQRGPTYVNVTEGSFCCMHCSGLLRGLNPPHRVKSISMSTFSDDDVKKLKLLGNEENQKIWLGLLDKKIKFEPRVEDEVRQHLIQKYENKRWHVSPDDLMQQKQLLEQHFHNRRDSVSSHSIHSHQSNQSAPPNLNPSSQTGKQATLDLLTGDIFGVPSQINTGSLAALPTPFGSNFNPLSHSSQPSALAFPTHMQHAFQSSEKTPTASDVTLGSASITAPAGASATIPDFAAFDTNFGSLNLNQSSTSCVSNPSIHPANSAEKSASSSVASRPPLPQSSPVVWPSQSKSAALLENVAQGKASTPSYFEKLDSDILRHSITSQQHQQTTTSDGKPIMSVCNTLPDYSALEDLFRGSSSSSTTTTAPSFGDPFPTSFGFTPSFPTTQQSETSQHSAFNKSSTIGNIGEFSTAFQGTQKSQLQPVTTTGQNLAPNPFYSMSNFTSCLPDPFAPAVPSAADVHSKSVLPNGVHGMIQPNSFQSAQDWNPFTN